MTIQFANPTSQNFASKMLKRQREDGVESKRPSKKAQKGDAIPLKAFTPRPNAPAPAAEIDFPRGGGSSFTPLETKAIRAEAIQELKEEHIFQVRTVRACHFLWMV